MFMFKIRNAISSFFTSFWWKHKKKFKVTGLAIVFLIAGFFGVRLAVNAITHRVAVHRFNNMSREDMIYDFEYLMTALEESWPFFNLSISANNVDVHELSNNTRALLNNPATDISSPLDFLDIIEEHFFTPISQLGHLRTTSSYESYFALKEELRWSIEHGANNRTTAYFYDLSNRPEVVMFYSRLRDEGRGSPRPQVPTGPVMAFDSLETGRIAYMRVNRMISLWEDTYAPAIGDRAAMWSYELQAYNFTQFIEEYEHLIIDFRENPGGQTFHLRAVVMPMFLHEGVTLPSYVFYMGGEYASLAREIFDIRHIYPAWIQDNWENEFGSPDDIAQPQQVHFSETLPYLDIQIDFAYAFESSMGIGPVYNYYGILNSVRQEVLFNGKIWLLVDERTASAAEAMTAIIKYNNIATVVGEPTFGIMAVSYEANTINMSLPNTGILVRFDIAYYTDLYGRPLQGYGIQPHYHNRPGMDALETVLALIKEGN